MSKVIVLSDGAYQFLCTHLPSDGTDAKLVEGELSNHSLAMLDEVSTALTGAEGEPGLPEADYVLTDKAAWFTVGPFSVRIRLYDGELKMTAHKLDDEDNEHGPYAEAVAYVEDLHGTH